MSSITAAYGRSALSRPTLADRLVSRSILTDVMLVAGGAAFTGLLAQVFIPIQPVPITGQTLAVLLVGSTLGAWRGAASMVLYLVLGMAGVPWFSEGAHGVDVVLGASGGYIVGFIAAAALTGWIAERQWDQRVLGAIVSFTAGTVVVFAIGMTWLAVAGGFDLNETLLYGLYPFIPGGIIKALLAAGIIPLAWKLTTRRK
jgi:biotin transport system substrate-specific component